MIFSIFNILLIPASLPISLIATPIQSSFLKPSQSKSYSHPLPNLERRGGSVSSRSSSYPSLDSESTSPPEAPVLKTHTMDDGGNQGQKRKRVRSDVQRSKIKEAARKAYARKEEEIKGDPAALAAKKQKKSEKNARATKKRLASFKANPEAKTAWKAKTALTKVRYNLKRESDFMEKFDDKQEAIAAWKLEKTRLNHINYLKYKAKKAKMALEANANLLMTLRAEDNEREEGNETIVMIEDTDQDGKDTIEHEEKVEEDEDNETETETETEDED
jgi:hypothetical protein